MGSLPCLFKALILPVLVLVWADLPSSVSALDVGTFETGAVCGEDGVNYLSKDAAHEAGVRAMHGGLCGECSNMNDIKVYHDTRNTMTGFATGCAFKFLMFGKKAARKCMAKSKLSEGCLDCWVDNIQCTVGKCMWICLKSRMMLQPRNLPDGSMNPCLQCDEDNCGPPFIECAGANRRRSGIRSDIDRPGDQVWEGDEWLAALPDIPLTTAAAAADADESQDATEGISLEVATGSSCPALQARGGSDGGL